MSRLGGPGARKPRKRKIRSAEEGKFKSDHRPNSLAELKSPRGGPYSLGIRSFVLEFGCCVIRT